MKKTALQILACAMAALLLAACERKPAKTKEQVMQERLDERLNKWIGETKAKCLGDMEDKAAILTDSIVIENAKLNRDTSIQSLIPNRPARPDYKPPTDSVPVKPILEK